MDNELSEITSYVLRETGENLSKYEETFLLKSIEKRLIATGVNSKKDYLSLLGTNREECLALKDSLIICYSDFFRNPVTFAFMERHILPSLFSLKQREHQKEVRIWSAASASGQEAYSLAILCEELIATSNIPLTYRIFATDIDPAQVAKASEGVFSTTMVGNISLKRLNTYFKKQGENYVISTHIKNRVIFSQFDLLSKDSYCPPSSIFGEFDIVFCSNLLFYYKPNHRHSILDKISKCISAGSYLVTGEAERETLSGYGFTEVFPYSAIFQMNKKGKNVEI